MAGDNGAKFTPDAFAQAMKPLFDGLSERFSRDLKEEIGKVVVKIDEKLDETNERIDKLIDSQGDHYRGLESRVKRLEDKVFPSGS